MATRESDVLLLALTVWAFLTRTLTLPQKSAAGVVLLRPRSRIRDMQQISRDKFDRLPRTTVGFTTSVLDEYGLRRHWPLRPTP